MRKKYTSEIIHRHGEKENPKGIWQIREFLVEEDGIGVVEVILILVGIFTPYYGVGIRCMA